MKIFFIRHGETTGDVENRSGGTYDDHSSSTGEEQSKALAAALATTGIEAIFASSLIRAQETASILANSTNSTVETIADLEERNQYSFLSGMNKNEAREKYPTEVEALKDRLTTIEGLKAMMTSPNVLFLHLRSALLQTILPLP